MEIDDKVREALDWEPEREPVLGADWGAFRRRARRARAIQAAASGALALIVLMVVLTIARAPSSTSPAQDPSPSVVDEEVGYVLDLPEGWGERDARSQAGSYRMFAPLADVPITLEIRAEQPRPYSEWFRYQLRELDALSIRGLVEVTQRDLEIGGRPATTVGLVFREPVTGTFDCRCRIVEYFVDWTNNWVVRVTVKAVDRDTFEQYGPEALTIVSSIRQALSTVPRSHGTVAPGIDLSPEVEGLVHFLEARIAGSDAEAFLWSDARASYDEAGPPWLYAAEPQDGSGPNPYDGYSVLDAGDDPSAYTVELIYDTERLLPDRDVVLHAVYERIEVQIQDALVVKNVSVPDENPRP